MSSAASSNDSKKECPKLSSACSSPPCKGCGYCSEHAPNYATLHPCKVCAPELDVQCRALLHDRPKEKEFIDFVWRCNNKKKVYLMETTGWYGAHYVPVLNFIVGASKFGESVAPIVMFDPEKKELHYLWGSKSNQTGGPTTINTRTSLRKYTNDGPARLVLNDCQINSDGQEVSVLNGCTWNWSTPSLPLTLKTLLD